MKFELHMHINIHMTDGTYRSATMHTEIVMVNSSIFCVNDNNIEHIALSMVLNHTSKPETISHIKLLDAYLVARE